MTLNDEHVVQAQEDLQALGACFDQLQRAMNEFKRAYARDETMEIFLPARESLVNTSRAQKREQALASMTQLWHDDEQYAIPSGLVCASPRTIESAQGVNDAKMAFKAVISHIRKTACVNKNVRNSKLSAVVERLCSTVRERQPTVKFALNAQHLSRLKFDYVYRRIGVLPPGTVSISWSWSQAPSSVTPLTYQEACEMAEQLSEEEARDFATAQMAGITDAYLAHVKKKKRQLRANILCPGVDPKTGEEALLPRSITTASILLVSGETLPRRKWANMTPGSRMIRHDVHIDPEPFLPLLSLHQYLPGKGPKRLASAG